MVVTYPNKTVITERQNGEERGFQLVGGWCQTGCTECFTNLPIDRDFHAQPSPGSTVPDRANTTRRLLCGGRCFVDARGARVTEVKAVGLMGDHKKKKATGTQITTGYNQDLQKTISERTTCPTSKRCLYTNRYISKLTDYLIDFGDISKSSL